MPYAHSSNILTIANYSTVIRGGLAVTDCNTTPFGAEAWAKPAGDATGPAVCAGLAAIVLLCQHQLLAFLTFTEGIQLSNMFSLRTFQMCSTKRIRKY